MNQTADYELSVVIPVYNEQESLHDLFDALTAYKQKASVKVCFLFVNDGSSDNSLNFIKQFCLSATDFYYISLEKRSGLTGALKAGFSEVKSDWVGYMDADLQTFPDDFELLLKNRYQGELICGIRVKRHDSVSKKIQSKLANKIRNLVTHDGISDTNCPLKIGRTNLLNRLPLFSGMHRFLPALVKMTGNRVYTVPVRHQERKHGVSKFNLANRAFSGLEDLFAFAWMRSRYIEPSVAESDLKDR